jgi:ankyrin repeat protein
LHWAAFNGKKDVASLLLEYEADVNAPNHWRNTPLYWAVLRGHTEIVKLLLTAGANSYMGSRKYKNNATTLLHTTIEIRDIVLNWRRKKQKMEAFLQSIHRKHYLPEEIKQEIFERIKS